MQLANNWRKHTRSVSMQVTMDEVPKDWLPPYEGDGSGDSLFRPESAKQTSSKSSLQPKRQRGMQQVVSSRRSGYCLSLSCSVPASVLCTPYQERVRGQCLAMI